MNKDDQIKRMAHPNRGSVGVQEARPPQRTWVGLTDEQIWQIATDSTIGSDLHADKFAEAIEAKLKEKNT
jgi:hypothetical protein